MYRWVIPPPLNTAFAFFSFFFCFSSRNALILTFSSEFFISSYPQGFIWNEDEIVASIRMLLWLTPMLFFFFLVLLFSSELYWIEFYSQGPRKGRGWEGGGAGPPHFSKKKKLRNTHFLIKGIFDGIRILDWRTSPEHPNLWLVRFDPLSLWQASKWLSLQNYT